MLTHNANLRGSVWRSIMRASHNLCQLDGGTMAGLFSPMDFGREYLRNRIVRAPLPTGAASPGGFVSEELIAYYAARAAGGTSLIITEPISVIPLDLSAMLALHDDSFIPGLRRLRGEVQTGGAVLAALLSSPPLPLARLQTEPLTPVREAFVAAVWRAYAAGCSAVILDGADGLLLHQLLSPYTNRRADSYGEGPSGRMQLALEIVEEVRRWLGSTVMLGYRLPADDLLPDGLSLQDSRVFAKRLVAAGVSFLDVTAGYPADESHVARFPGWQVPLASAIRSIAEVPVIANGQLDDPLLADSIIADGSADLIGIADALDDDPSWPRRAAEALGIDAEQV